MAWHIFLSFEDEDIGTVEVFREHMAQEEVELVFHDYPVKEPFESVEAKDTKSHLLELLEETAMTMVLIGRTTYADKWVDWEVRTSAGMGKALLGVRLHSDLDHIIPRALRDYNTEILDPNPKAVVEAVERKAREEDRPHFEIG